MTILEEGFVTAVVEPTTKVKRIEIAWHAIRASVSNRAQIVEEIRRFGRPSESGRAVVMRFW